MSLPATSGLRTATGAPQVGALPPTVADLRMPVLIVPGLRDSAPVHWQSQWQRQIPGARRVAQQDWQNPDVARWTEALRRELAAAPEPPMIIAHSFGCLATVCAAYAGANIRAALLVAPADPERFGIDADLTDRPLPFTSTMIASSNDPWLKLMRAGALASIWGSQLVVYRNAGHINAESGFGPWPQGLTHVHELASRAAHRDSSALTANPFAN